MCRGGTEKILVGGCSRWSYQVRAQRGRPKRRFMEVVRACVQIVVFRVENAEDWRDGGG